MKTRKFYEDLIIAGFWTWIILTWVKFINDEFIRILLTYLVPVIFFFILVYLRESDKSLRELRREQECSRYFRDKKIQKALKEEAEFFKDSSRPIIFVAGPKKGTKVTFNMN